MHDGYSLPLFYDMPSSMLLFPTMQLRIGLSVIRWWRFVAQNFIYDPSSLSR
jgi:hypothetical protein